MTWTTETYLSLISLIVTAVIVPWLARVRDQRIALEEKVNRQRDECDKRMEQVRRDAEHEFRQLRDAVGRMEVKIDVFWKDIGLDAARILRTRMREREERKERDDE